MTCTVPVMKEELSLNSHATNSATSSGWPFRFSAQVGAISPPRFRALSRDISVSIIPLRVCKRGWWLEGGSIE